MFQEINKRPVGELLEIGVGNGAHLKEYKGHQITGIDTSAMMLATAFKQDTPNINLIQMNGECILFKDSIFDYIVLSHVIAVVDDPEKLLDEAYRVLKPGGQVFILNHFTPNNWLRHIDSGFSFVAKLFHFKSVFYINSLVAIKRFKLMQEIGFGRFTYFKLLIYCKA